MLVGCIPLCFGIKISERHPISESTAKAFDWLKFGYIDSLQMQYKKDIASRDMYSAAIIDFLLEVSQRTQPHVIAKQITTKYQLTDYERDLFSLEVYKCNTRLFGQAELYYHSFDALEKICLVYEELDDAYLCLSSQATLAMMFKDFNKMQGIIDRMFASSMFKDSMLRSKMYLQVGLLNDSAQRDSAEYYMNKAYTLGVKHIKEEADSVVVAVMLRALSNIQVKEGKLLEAIDHLIISQKLIPPDDLYNLSRVENYYILSTIYLDLSNIRKAEDYALKSLKLAEDNNYKMYKEGRCISQMGDVQRAKKNYDQSLEYSKKAFAFYSDKWINKIDPKLSAAKTAFTYGLLNNPDQQQAWLDSASLYTVDSKETDFFIQFNKALQLENQKNYTAALNAYQKLLEQAKVLKSVSKSNQVNKRLYQLYKTIGNSPRSLEYLEAYTQAENKIYRNGQEAAVSELNANYKLELKDQQIINLNSRNELTQTKVDAQQKLIIIAMIALVLLSALLFALYRMYQRSEAQKALIAKADEEKKVLLKEIHHRVKNNLQVISSLLKLQSKYIKDENAVKAIAEGRTRVQSMALLHQNLYQDDNLTGVDMKQYFDNLIQGLFDAYNIEEDRITLVTDIEDLSLDVDTVIPLGLITNELISNSLKHAFKNEAKGSITVSLKQVNKRLELIVKDDGVGKSIAGKSKSSSGFGQMLISSLSNKLDAEIFETQDNGTEIKIVMKDFILAA